MQGKISYLKLSRQQVSILLTVISLLLWLHSIIHAKLEIGFFGLIHGLPITFFIALAILAIASSILWVSKEKHGKLLCLQLLILVSTLWLIPTVTGGSPPVVNHDYRNIGMIDYIVSHGHFASSVAVYFSWPGTFIASAIITEVSLLNFETLINMGLMPFLMQLLCLVPLYVFLKNTLGEERSNYCWFGCWLFYLAEWVVHVHLNPQGFGLFFLLILLALVTNSQIWQNSTKRGTLFVVLITFFAALAVTHLLTSLAVLSVLVGLIIYRKDKYMALVVGICIVLLASWNLTEARMLERKIKTSEGFVTIQQTTPPDGAVVDTAKPSDGIVEPVSPPDKTTESIRPPDETIEPTMPSRTILVLDPELIAEREITRRMSGSQEHISLVRIRLLFSGIFALIGLAGAILVCVFRRNLKTGVPLFIISLAPLMLLILSSQYGELLPRIYLFTLPGMAYFGAILIDIKSRKLIIILCLLPIILCPLHVISRYGNQEMDYISQPELMGADFFYRTTSSGYVIGSWPMGVMKEIDKYRQISMIGLNWHNVEAFITKQSKDIPFYVSIGRQDEKRYEFFRGNNYSITEIQEIVINNIHGDSIYKNQDLILYKL